MAGWESGLLAVGGGRAWLVVGAVLLIRSAETLRAERPGCGLWTNTMCFLLERRGVRMQCGFYLLQSVLFFSLPGDAGFLPAEGPA